MRFVTQLFAPSLLRALVGRTVAVAVGALVVLAAIALYESNDLVAKQFEDEATIVAQAAANGIEGQSTLLVRQASLLAGLPTIRDLTEAKDRFDEHAISSSSHGVSSEDDSSLQRIKHFLHDNRHGEIPK